MKQSALERELEWRIAQIVEELDFELWDLEYSGRYTARSLLRVVIYHPEGVGVEDCARVNLAIRRDPEIETLMGGPFTLEVSSPGIFRELKYGHHFEKMRGTRVTAVLKDGRKFTGELVRGDDMLVVLRDGRLEWYLPRAILRVVHADPILKFH